MAVSGAQATFEVEHEIRHETTLTLALMSRNHPSGDEGLQLP
jgi:hypothetical protein